MKEFTFIVITYNHQDVVVEHLESIKYQIQNFGESLSVDLIIADDKSRDSTIDVVESWLEQDRELFRNVKIIRREENVGTITNIKEAIDCVKTEHFKFLAGDDKYYINNIFELFDSKSFIVTPVVLFGECNNSLDYFRNCYKLLLQHNTVKKLKGLLKYGCLIPAPGVFISDQYFRDENLWKRNSQFRLIEDYPSWYYIFNNYEDIDLKILTKPYICYRIGSGISTGQTVNLVYKEEEKRVLDYVGNRLRTTPKYLNIHQYVFWLKKKVAEIISNEDTKKIDSIYKREGQE